MKIEQLKKKVFSDDWEIVKSSISELAQIGGDEITLFLIELLEQKESGIRNRAALALEELKDNRAVEPLIKAIKKPENHEYNGTMVFALESLNCSSKIVDIFRILFEETYESKVSANAILEEQEFQYSNDDYDKVTKMWNNCNNNKEKYPGFDDEETYEMMKENYELFRQTVKGIPTDNNR